MKLSPPLKVRQENFEHSLTYLKDSLYNQQNELHKACRYALEGPGKRIRPLLVLLSAEVFDSQNGPSLALNAALAIEMIHCYSLVHDDLPALDNDDLRRGRPTVHKVFNEAIAVLVGDTLQSDAFALLSTGPESLGADQKLAMMRTLSTAIGSKGMVNGQALDMEWTNQNDYSKSILDEIHQLKTGKLIAASCSLGALSAGADLEQARALFEFGEKLGLAFQIIDDLLDTSASNGKTRGKDLAQNKLTYLKQMSQKDAEIAAQSLTDEAFSILRGLGKNTVLLEELAQLLLKRQA